MNINDAFPSKYLKASDLQGTEPTVTIDRVDWEVIGNENKPILYFEGKTKGIVLNKTNGRAIGNALGPMTENWKGHKIILFAIMTDYQGQAVQGLRVRMLNGAAPAQTAQAPMVNQPTMSPTAAFTGAVASEIAVPAGPPTEILDDEIPF